MINRLSQSIREYKKDSILAPIYVSLEVLLEVVIPILMASLIDYGIDAGNLNYVLKMGIMLLTFAGISLLTGALAGRSAAIASSGFAKNLRQDMYYNVQNFSFSNIDKFSTASIVTRLTTDVTNVQNAFQMIIRMAFRAPIMLTFAMIAAFRIHAQLSLIFLVAVPVLGIGLYIIMIMAHPIFEQIFKIYDRLNSIIQENLHGVRVVKSFIREEYEEEKFMNVSDQIYQNFTKAEKILAFNMPLMQFCMYSCTLLISWFGARLIITSGNDPVSGLSTGTINEFNRLCYSNFNEFNDVINGFCHDNYFSCIG